MKSLDGLTIYSAVVATFALLLTIANFCWDRWKWRSTTTARLKITALANCKSGEKYPNYVVNNIPITKETDTLHIQINNVGLQRTTIMCCSVIIYRNRIAKWRNLPEANYIIPPLNKDKPLPYELASGQTWSGDFPQPLGLRETFGSKKIVRLEVIDNISAKPFEVRILYIRPEFSPAPTS